MEIDYVIDEMSDLLIDDSEFTFLLEKTFYSLKLANFSLFAPFFPSMEASIDLLFTF